MNEFKIEIPIETEGKSNSSGQSNYDKQLLIQQKNSTSMLSGILKATAIVAAVWTALSPILTPLLKLLSLLLLVVFLPLLPYIKDIAKKIGETVKAVKAGQASGDSPMSSFTGGIGALFGDVSFVGTAIGTAIGIAFGAAALAALSGPAIIGALAILLGTAIVFENIGEDEIKNKLGAAGIIGLAAGIAAGIVTGNPIVGVLTGAVVFALSMSILPDAIQLDDIKKAIKAAGLAAVIAGGIAALFFGAPGFIIVGTVTFILSMIFDLTRDKDPFEDMIDKEYNNQEMSMTRQFTGTVISPELQKQIDNIDLTNYKSELNETEDNWVTLNMTAQNVLGETGERVNGLSYKIGDLTNASSLSSNLVNSSNEFTNMANVSNNAVNNIISSLDRIPKKVITIHEIRTVKTSSGGFSL